MFFVFTDRYLFIIEGPASYYYMVSLTKVLVDQVQRSLEGTWGLCKQVSIISNRDSCHKDRTKIGARIASKDGDCPGQAAPKHVFVARTAMSTTKETVEGCLEYLSGIKGEATCCTPQERLDSGEAFSLSWRVQVDSCDFEKALQPSSWKTGWAVKPYFFRRKRPERHLGQGQGHLGNFFAQAGQGVHLSQGIHP